MAEKVGAVLFSQWGVVAPSRRDIFDRFEMSRNLPSGFLSKVSSHKDSALHRAERGEISLSQMILELEIDCLKELEVQGLTFKGNFSVRGLIEELREKTDVNADVLQTAVNLRQSGLLTAVVANQWVDDCANGASSARLLSLLSLHFDKVFLSCRLGHRVPEPAMFMSALQCLGVTPQQAVWLDVDEESVIAAEAEGMKGILVKNMSDGLSELACFTGEHAYPKILPLCCRPTEVSHGYVNIKPGVRTHYVEMGTGPPVLLCHGFPESWFSWRYQIPALAIAGFRVLALDMKGYGGSTAPQDIEEYAIEQLCQDLITFLDKMQIPQVTLVGHDWGGALVWAMARYHPEKVRAVASLNTPLFPVNPSVNPMERLKAVPIFDYQLYFQEPGVAEAELEKDLERTFKLFFYGSGDTANQPTLTTAGVRARGGLFVGLPQEIPRSSILSEEALQYYVSQYEDRGFRGPLNWYRNIERNWKWMCSRPRGKLMMPALMVTAGKDPVLSAHMTKGMEDIIPGLARGHIEESGHWTQMEKPSEVNRLLISWLQDLSCAPTSKL